MHLQDHNELLDDSIKAVYARNLVRDMEQTEDEAYSGNEMGALYTYCTSLQTVDTEAVSKLAPSAASVCTFVINSESLGFGISNVGFIIDTNVEDDDFSDDDPIEIEVKPERQQHDKDPLFGDLYRIYRECSESNWDSEDADPINEKAFLEALTLLNQLPSDLPLPEIIPEPTGNIAIEWYKGKRNVFVISVCGENKIEYAGLFGKLSKSYGAEYFSDELPELIVSHINRLFK